MAVVTGNWYHIEFHPFTDASWTGIAISSFPTLPGVISGTIIAGTTYLLYVIDDSGPITFVGEGMGQFMVPAATIAVEGSTSKLDTTLDNGTTWTSVIDTDGSWKFYDSVAGVQSLASPAALKAFLP